MFFSRNFMVSGLTFRSLIHFEFIFVHTVRKYSNFILHVAVQFSQHHLLKRLSFLCCIFLPPSISDIIPICLHNARQFLIKQNTFLILILKGIYCIEETQAEISTLNKIENKFFNEIE